MEVQVQVAVFNIVVWVIFVFRTMFLITDCASRIAENRNDPYKRLGYAVAECLILLLVLTYITVLGINQTTE